MLNRTRPDVVTPRGQIDARALRQTARQAQAVSTLSLGPAGWINGAFGVAACDLQALREGEGDTGALTVREDDGAPSVAGVTTLEFHAPDFVVTDQTGGVARVASGLAVQESDNAPVVSGVNNIKFQSLGPGFRVTDQTGGVALVEQRISGALAAIAAPVGVTAVSAAPTLASVFDTDTYYSPVFSRLFIGSGYYLVGVRLQWDIAAGSSGGYLLANVIGSAAGVILGDVAYVKDSGVDLHRACSVLARSTTSQDLTLWLSQTTGVATLASYAGVWVQKIADL